MNELSQLAAKALPLYARLLALPLLVELASRWLLAGSVLNAESLLWRAVLVLVFAVLLLPQPASSRRATVWLLAWGAFSTLVLLLGSVATAGLAQLASAQLWYLAVGTGLLVWLFAALVFSLSQCLGDRRVAARIGLGTLLLSLSLPMWLAPFVSLFGAARWMVNSVVALCPVSYLAALAGVDYLRSDWFYRHTPFGGLRYDYPQPVCLSLAIGLLLVLLLLLGGRRWHTRSGPAIVHSQASELLP